MFRYSIISPKLCSIRTESLGYDNLVVDQRFPQQFWSDGRKQAVVLIARAYNPDSQHGTVPLALNVAGMNSCRCVGLCPHSDDYHLLSRSNDSMSDDYSAMSLVVDAIVTPVSVSEPKLGPLQVKLELVQSKLITTCRYEIQGVCPACGIRAGSANCRHEISYGKYFLRLRLRPCWRA